MLSNVVGCSVGVDLIVCVWCLTSRSPKESWAFKGGERSVEQRNQHNCQRRRPIEHGLKQDRCPTMCTGISCWSGGTGPGVLESEVKPLCFCPPPPQHFQVKHDVCLEEHGRSSKGVITKGARKRKTWNKKRKNSGRHFRHLSLILCTYYVDVFNEYICGWAGSIHVHSDPPQNFGTTIKLKSRIHSTIQLWHGRFCRNSSFFASTRLYYQVRPYFVVYRALLDDVLGHLHSRRMHLHQSYQLKELAGFFCQW